MAINFPMKICIINNIYPPYNRGGAEQVVIKTIQGLQHAGHDVVLITSSPKGDEFAKEHGITIYRVKPLNIFFYTNLHHYPVFLRAVWHVLDTFNISVAKKVQKILTKEQPDVVHTHNLMGLSFLIPRVIKAQGIRHIHTVHDVQLVEPSAMIIKEKEHAWRYNSPFTTIYSLIMSTLMGSPHVVISPSQFLKDFYQKRGFFTHSEMYIIRNPMTFDLQKQPTKTANKKTTQCSFLYVGQVEFHKGIDSLVDAFSSFKEKNVSLHIVGDGSKLDMLKEKAKHQHNIHIHGKVPHDELPKLFSDSDVTIVPSLCYENSPTVIFESFAFGIPVIASNIEGIAELIVEGENGFTFTAGDASALTQKIEWCIDHKAQIATMKQKTSASLVGLSIDSYIKALMSHYRS